MSDAYQLDGGVLKYLERVGQAHWRGTCFVFDERVALDVELRAPSVDPTGCEPCSKPDGVQKSRLATP